MPPEVVALFPGNLQYGVNFIGNDLVRPGWPIGYVGFSPHDWTTMYQEMVKFINEAIGWENVLYFLYSYFWDVPESWDFIRPRWHKLLLASPGHR